MSQSRLRTLVPLMASLALGGAACNDDGPSEPGEAAAKALAAKPKKVEPPRAAMYELRDYSRLCSESPPLVKPGQAAPKDYDASRVLQFRRFSPDDPYGIDYTPKLGELYAKTPAEVRYVACVDLRYGEQLGHCSYYGGSLEYKKTEHTVRIIDAQTSQEVTRDEFAFESMAGCPGSHKFPASGAKYRIGADYTPRLLSSFAPVLDDSKSLMPNPSAHELRSVCFGNTFPQAKPYAEGADNEVYVTYKTRESYLGSGGPPHFPQNKDVGKVSDYSTVICAVPTLEKRKRRCKFYGGKSLEYHSGSVNLTVREARTGRIIAEESLASSGGGSCPYSYKFNGWKVVKKLGRLNKKKVAAFMKSVRSGQLGGESKMAKTAPKRDTPAPETKKTVAKSPPRLGKSKPRRAKRPKPRKKRVNVASSSAVDPSSLLE